MKILITGSDGFIGKNLCAHFSQSNEFDVFKYTRKNNKKDLENIIQSIDFIIHAAGVNRPKNNKEFFSGNSDLTEDICHSIENIFRKYNRYIPIIFTSTSQAELDNPYGRSKQKAENSLKELNFKTGNPIFIFRLPNVFGKWSRIEYNSVVATFCYKISRGLPIRIDDPRKVLKLVYIDDLVNSFLSLIHGETPCTDELGFCKVEPLYKITLSELSNQLYKFFESRNNLITEPVGEGLVRALYSTYLTYLPSESFLYSLKAYQDNRGMFVEFLKTKNSGQFSFFTAKSGITRGDHFHHSKSEKFLVLKGQAMFKFKHILSKEEVVIEISSDSPEVVESIPGWSHNITNIGDEDLIVMLWANEVFDRSKPDTYSNPI